MKKKVGSGWEDVGQKAYDTTAEFGLFMALLSMIGGIFISLILIGVGIWLTVKKQERTETVYGIVKKASCTLSTNTKNCLLEVEYTVNGKTYNNKVESNNAIYNDGSTVKLKYNPANPNDVSVATISLKTIGFILIGVGVVIMFSSILWYYIARRFKIAAAATGVGAVADIVTPN